MQPWEHAPDADADERPSDLENKDLPGGDDRDVNDLRDRLAGERT